MERGRDVPELVQNIKISMVQSCVSKEPKEALLMDVLSAIVKGERYSLPIATYRNMLNTNDGKAALYKKSEIPAFTPSGLFKDGRTKDHLVEYTAIMVLDIDDLELDEVDNVFRQIIKIPYTLCAFKSPSGNGIKIIVYTDSNDPVMHEKAFNEVCGYYSSVLKIRFDPNGKDYTRLCIVSSDTDGYLSTQVEQFTLNKGRPIVAFGFTSGYRQAIEWTERIHGQFKNGIRNNYIHLLACNCNRLGLDQGMVTKKILTDHLSDGEFTESEIKKTISSAYRNQNEFGQLTVRAVARGVPVAGVAQHNINSFKSFRQLADEGKNMKPKGKLFGDYILERSTVIFPSERGVGKSLFVMQLAMVIAKGVPSFLNEEINVHGNVIYINLELNEETVSRRLHQLDTMYGEYVSTYEPYCLTSRSGLMPLIGQIKEYCLFKKPVLLIIDNLRTALAGADNEKNKEMTVAMGTINQLKDEIGASLLIVHHTKKGTSNKLTDSDMQSGAGALTDLADADFFLRNTGVDKNLRLLIRKKSRDAEGQEGAKLISLNPETLWFEFVEDGVSEGKYMYTEAGSKSTEELKQAAQKLKDEGLSYAEIGRKLGRDRSSVKRWFE